MACVKAFFFFFSSNYSAKLPDLRVKAGETKRAAMQVVLRNDVIPEELLATLTSAAHPYCKTECSSAHKTSQTCKVCKTF